MLIARVSENMTHELPQALPRRNASAELPRPSAAQKNLVFGPRLEEFLCCASIVDLPFKKTLLNLSGLGPRIFKVCGRVRLKQTPRVPQCLAPLRSSVRGCRQWRG